MLNKNQSNKSNSWKYALVLPLLGAFVFFFQVKVVAEDKKMQVHKTVGKLEIIKSFYVSKETTDETINSEVEKFKKEYKTDVVFSKIKRNTQGEIIALKVDITCPNQKTNSYQSLNYKVIKPLLVFLSKKKNSNEIVGFSASSEIMSSKNWRLYDSNGLYEMPTPLPPKTSRAAKNIKNISNSNTLLPPPPPKTPRPTKDIEKPIIILNGKRTQTTFEDLNKLDPNLIQSMKVLKGKNAVDKYGKEGENGAIEISTKENVDLLKSSSKNEQDRKEEVQSRKNEIQVRKDKIQSRKDEVQAKKDKIQARKDEVQARKDDLQARKDEIQAKIDAKQALKDAEQAKKDTM